MSEKIAILKELGIKFQESEVDLAFQILETNPQFKDFLSTKKQTPSSKHDEDFFIETIKTSHTRIAQIPENTEVIQNRENTFTIRAIDPNQIVSLTDRAFFNSFNLQRNALNDINTKNQEVYEPRKEDRKRAWNDDQNRGRMQGQQEQKCICEKIIPGSEWVQCMNEDKCRGSNWYHIECAGFSKKDSERLKDQQFTCEACARDFKDDESEESSRKKRKNDKEQL